MKSRTIQYVLRGIILACALAASAALEAANPPTSSNGTTDSALRPEAELTEKFTALAGSTRNAQALVDGLRNGTSIVLTDSVRASTTIVPPTQPMGFGNINIALSLARQELSQQGITQPTSSQLQAALTGGTITTSTGSTPTKGVLTLRSQGMGWGAIANSLGFKLGEVVRSNRAERIGTVEKPEKANGDNNAAKPERIEVGRVDKVERPERPVRPERPDRAGK